MTNSVRLFTSFAVLCVSLNAVAQTGATGATPGFAASLRQPAEWLTLGGDLRIRNEYFNQAVTLGSSALREQDVLRYRGRVSAAARVAEDVSFNARFIAEPRQWVKPAFAGACKTKEGWESRFAMFDNFAVKFTKLGGAPVTLTVGRQDIQLAEPTDCWLVADGTPGDGSWSIFLDSARLTAELPEFKTKLDVIAIRQNSRPDAWLPTIGRTGNYPYTDQDERGAIVYLTNKSLPGTQVDGYFMYKHDDRRAFTIANVVKTPGDDADLGTVGARVSGALGATWTYSTEAAWQFGSKMDRISGVFARRDVRAYGAKGRLTKNFNDSCSNQLNFNVELLSGDDRGSAGRDEMFDVLWGRWPRWSELYIYSYINETGGRIAQMNNLARLAAGWTTVPVKGTTCSLTYSALLALEPSPTRAITPGAFSGSGRTRGHLVQAVLKRQFNKYTTGHLWFEAMRQADYYTTRHTMTFARAEIMFAF